MNTIHNYAPSVTQLLKEVVTRVEGQLMAQAAFTLKKDAKIGDQVLVTLKGCESTYMSTVTELLDQVKDFDEKQRQINVLSDFFICFFITAIKKEKEAAAMQDVIDSINFLYGVKASVTRVIDINTGEEEVTFFNEASPKVGVTLTADQVEQEYNTRFLNEENKDLVADLADLFKTYADNGIEETKKLAASLGRTLKLIEG